MNTATTIGRMLERYGEKLTVYENGESRDTHGVIQPLMYKNKMYINGVSLPAGYFDGGHYILIASATPGITDYRNTTVYRQTRAYRIKRVEVITSGGADLYIWAVLTPAKPRVEDDYDSYDRSA